MCYELSILLLYYYYVSNIKLIVIKTALFSITGQYFFTLITIIMIRNCVIATLIRNRGGKTRQSLYKMRHGLSHVFLSAVWSKMRPNPMEIPSFSQKMPWKFHDLNLSKIHVLVYHGKQKIQMNDLEFSLNLASILTKLPSICDMK